MPEPETLAGATRLLRIPPEEVENFLPMIGKWFETIKRSVFTKGPQGAIDLVMQREADLWSFWEDDFSECLGLGLTQPVDNDDGTVVCHVPWLGGRGMSRWRVHFPEIENWAKLNYGASRMRFMTNRPGMTKLMTDYDCIAVIYEKEIT
jgi:hypothetical protein